MLIHLDFWSNLKFPTSKTNEIFHYQISDNDVSLGHLVPKKVRRFKTSRFPAIF